jgi:hypothetical protein
LDVIFNWGQEGFGDRDHKFKYYYNDLRVG